MKIDIQKLIALLKGKKFEEAQQELTDFVKSPLTKEEEGEILTNKALLQMGVMGKLDEEYARSVNELLELVKKLDTEETQEKDKGLLQSIRKRLGI